MALQTPRVEVRVNLINSSSRQLNKKKSCFLLTFYILLLQIQTNDSTVKNTTVCLALCCALGDSSKCLIDRETSKSAIKSKEKPTGKFKKIILTIGSILGVVVVCSYLGILKLTFKTGSESTKTIIDGNRTTIIKTYDPNPDSELGSIEVTQTIIEDGHKTTTQTYIPKSQ